MRPLPVRRLPVRRLLGAVLALTLLSTAACTRGTGATSGPAPSESPTSPSASTASAASATPGQPVELSIGESVSLSLKPRSAPGTEVDLAVTDVTRGSIRDLSDFVLDRQARQSTPYYVTVAVTNTGGGNLSGEGVLLWGFDSTGTVRPPADVVGTFPKCQPQRLPKRFAKGETARACLLYLVPGKVTLEAVQYRFNSDRPPYSWPAG